MKVTCLCAIHTMLGKLERCTASVVEFGKHSDRGLSKRKRVMDIGKRKVEEFFKSKGIEKRILDYQESTHDSAHAAEALGVELGQIAKSVLFIVDGNPVLVVISGDRRVDMKALKKTLGAKKVKFAGEKDVWENTGFDVGAVSPVGLPKKVRIYMDKSLQRYEAIYPAAGGTNNMFESTFEELKGLTGALLVDLSKEF